MTLEQFDRLIYYNEHVAGAALTKNNTVEIFTDGAQLYKDLAQEIENASQYIHILSYIVKPDEVLDGLEHLLEQKAAQGVEVRLLVDAVGSRHMKKKDYKRLKKKGIQTGIFTSGQMNYRNHRKILVIDGCAGYVGGFNFAREYLGKNIRMGYWRDTHLKLQGAAVDFLERCFAKDWEKTAEKYESKSIGTAVCSGEKETVPMQIISGGADCVWQHIRDNYLRLICMARRFIYIQTPYFVPDEAVFQALQMAALSGVDVRLMLPCKPDHLFVYWASYSYAAGLLASGVKCYTYNNGFLHAKGIIVDGEVCCYGTANMDVRSFRLNFEVNAVIYDKRTAEEMEQIFLGDMKSCTEFTWEMYEQRKWLARLKERVSCLLSPIL